MHRHLVGRANGAASWVDSLERRVLFFVQAYFMEVPISPEAIAAAPELAGYRSYDLLARVANGDHFNVAGLRADLSSGEFYNAEEGSNFAQRDKWPELPHLEFDTWVDAPGNEWTLSSPGRWIGPGKGLMDATRVNIVWARPGARSGAGDFTVARMTISAAARGTVEGELRSIRETNTQVSFAFNFGVEQRPAVVNSTITGRLVSDTDGDGRADAHPRAFANRQVWIDSDNDNRIDPGERVVRTDSNGVYTFENLWVGDYRIRTRIPDGWRRVTPGNGSYNVRIDGPGNIPTRDFALTQRGFLDVTGHVLPDLDRDGTPDRNGVPFVGRTVWADLDNDGRQDGNEPWTRTAADGSYRLADLPAGENRIRVRVPDGWGRSVPGRGWHAVAGAGSAVSTAECNFALTQTSVLSVVVFHDLNSSGHLNAGEPGVNVRQVFIDDNSNGIFDLGERAVTPDTVGFATFGKLPPGTYRLVLLPDARLSHTTPAGQTVTVSGEIRTVYFGVKRIV